MGDRDLLESVVTEVFRSALPSAGDNLAGFAEDAERSLRATRVFSGVTVRRVGDPRCLLDIRAEVGRSAESLQAVSDALCSAWVSMAYEGFEASSCVWFREAMVLRFVTAMEGARLFVTGRVLVSGGPYLELVQRFEGAFGSLPDRRDDHGG